MIVDLFAGPGGWDEGLRLLGVDEFVVGIELDAAACKTRAAAGHQTIRGDVATLPTAPFAGKVTGLIASPPCPGFSQAGKGEGRRDIPTLHAFIHAFDQRGWHDPDEYDWHHPLSPLALQPLRWVQETRPSWIALEQVPDVLEVWRHFASVWTRDYFVWAGILNAANFGIPQTRKRAFLIAHRDRPVTPPVPTHARGGGSTLFGTLKPWVSMAEALGWGMTERTMPTLTAGGAESGGPEPIARGGRTLLEKEAGGGGHVVGYRRNRGAGMTERHGDRPDHPVDSPAPALTSKARSDEWVVDRRTNSKAGGGADEADRTR